MLVRRGSNGIAAPASHRGAVLTELELAALEDLGPLTRRAICYAALPTLAYSIVSQIIEFNDKIEAENLARAERGEQLKPYLDPKEPQLDLNLAKGIFQHNAQLILIDGTKDGAVDSMKILTPKLSARTARERRKTEGRRFRGW